MGNLTLGKLAAILTIATALIGAVVWAANVSSTASHADQTATTAIQKLDSKVDKDRFEQMEQDVRDIKNCLIKRECGGR